MDQQKRLRSKPVSLTNSRWAAYATAGAASALGGIGSAEAQIHYSGPLNVAVPPLESVAHNFALDNGAQIRFANIGTPSGSQGVALFRIEGAAASNMFRGLAQGNFRYPSNLAANALVSGGAFAAMNAAYFATLAYGSFPGLSQFHAAGVGFIGFRFNGGGGMEYGWARVNMDGTSLNGFTVVDYAWADVGTSIRAGQTTIPEPSSLGLLAVGAAGLAFWRKRRSAAVTGQN
jgi:PEP-CTERM motif